MKIAVTSASGIEATTKRELNKLGYGEPPFINGRAVFEGTEEDIIKCNLLLRTVGRVFAVIKDFPCSSFDELFEGVSSVNWSDYIDFDGQILIEPKLYNSKIYAFSATQSIVKKAICQSLLKNRAVLPENGARYKIEVRITNDVCSLSLDTSGDGLNKRGYRKIVGEAPLKETVAAALLELSHFSGQRPFLDPFCGTGTIAIEACLIALNAPVGVNRNFDFLNWKTFDSSKFEQLKSEAIGRLNANSMPKIIAIDIDEKQISLAKQHAKAAGVYDYIEFIHGDMSQFKTDIVNGVVVTNPPYGERMGERVHAEGLYRAYGNMAKGLKGWSFNTLTPMPSFERCFGRKAEKKRKIYNGDIECYFYSHLGVRVNRQ